MKKNFTFFGVKIIIILFFVAGSVLPVINGQILRTSVSWRFGLSLQFQKPWFQLWITYFGMSMFFLTTLVQKKRAKEAHKIIQKITIPIDFKIFRQVALPSICSILVNYLQNKALIYLPVTVWQMFFGFQVLFTTLFAVTYRKQQLFLVDWMSLFISVAGMCFSGVGALLRGIQNETTDSYNIFLSFILLILSNVIKAYQTIVEEKLLHDEGLNSASLTAYEGVWGLYLSSLILLPILSILPSNNGLGLYENTIETFRMIKKSTILIILLIFYTIIVALFSFLGIAITDYSSAIHRNMYETVRPIPIWILSLIIYYSTKNNDYGEKVDKYSSFELIGFVMALLGSLIYNRVIKFKCFIYIEEEEKKNVDYTINTNLFKSPLLSQGEIIIYTSSSNRKND